MYVTRFDPFNDLVDDLFKGSLVRSLAVDVTEKGPRFRMNEWHRPLSRMPRRCVRTLAPESVFPGLVCGADGGNWWRQRRADPG